MTPEVVVWFLSLRLYIHGAGYRTIQVSAENSFIAVSRNQDQELQNRGIDIWQTRLSLLILSHKWSVIVSKNTVSQVPSSVMYEMEGYL